MHLIRDVLAYEGDRLLDYKAEGHFAIRPSSILLVLFAMFYCLSGVDLVPELLVNPKAVGYIDDLLLSIAVIAYTYKDWSVLNGFGTIRSGDLPRTDTDRESEVRVRDGHEERPSGGSDPVSSGDTTSHHDPVEDPIITADIDIDGPVSNPNANGDIGQSEPVSTDNGSENGESEAEERRRKRAARRAQRAERATEGISEGDI